MLTVNIISYKYGHLAAQAVESVLSQTVKPDVIRFIDDGVGDTFHIKKLYPEVEYILRPTNYGVVLNFNTCLKETKTDRVMFLGADNWLHPRAIEKLLEFDEDIVTYDCYMVGGWDMGVMAQYEQDGYPVWKTQGTAHGSSMYNVQKALEAGGYEDSGGEHTEEDSVLFSKMVRAGASVGYLNSPLLYYRTHRSNFNER